MAVKNRPGLPKGTDISRLLKDDSLAYVEPCDLLLHLRNDEPVCDLTIRDIVLARTSYEPVDLRMFDVISHATIQAGGRGTEGSFSVSIPGTDSVRISLFAQIQKGQTERRVVWHKLPPGNWIEFDLSIHPEELGLHEIVLEVHGQSGKRTFQKEVRPIRMMVIDSYRGFRQHHSAFVGKLESVGELNGAAPDGEDNRRADVELLRTYSPPKEARGKIWVDSGFEDVGDDFFGNIGVL